MILVNGKGQLGLRGFLSIKAFGAFYFSFASSKFYLGLINNSGYGFGLEICTSDHYDFNQRAMI